MQDAKLLNIQCYNKTVKCGVFNRVVLTPICTKMYLSVGLCLDPLGNSLDCLKIV